MWSRQTEPRHIRIVGRERRITRDDPAEHCDVPIHRVEMVHVLETSSRVLPWANEKQVFLFPLRAQEKLRSLRGG